MRHKAMFLLLGTIVAMATNGLSIYRKGEEEGQISGGNIGDVVVRDVGSQNPSTIMIISESEWEAMPKNEEAAAEIEEAGKSKENLKEELAKAKNKISELEAELAESKNNIIKLEAALAKAKSKKGSKADSEGKGDDDKGSQEGSLNLVNDGKE